MININSSINKKILGLYFSNPQKKYYLRELSRILDIDPSNLSKKLKQLEKEGFFLSATKGIEKYFYLNQKHPLFEELKSIISKTEGITGSLKKELAKFAEIKWACIFGSFAKGSERSNSDVDVFIVGDVDFGKVNLKLQELEKKLDREINQVIYTAQEFRNKKKKSPFLKQVLNNKKIILIGADEYK
ncbi:MAG: nucleotidyltransferase domain-containing protein [Candidatus Kuenenbacteria bacterium]